jgi:hypothetical protein
VAALEQEAHERRAAEARTAAVGTGPDERRGTRGPKSPDQDRDAGSDRLERVVAMVADRVLETLARRDAARPTAMGQTKSPSEAQEPGRSQTPGKAKARQAETKHEINTPEQQANVTPEWLIPPRTETKLSEAEIAERARSSSVMERQRDVIAERSRIVMGSDQPGKDLIAEVEKNPSAAFEISRRFAASPATEAGLAGRPGSWIRSESRERQAARAELPQLAHAVDDYGRSLVSERARVVREHEADERRNQVGVPAPSPFLRAALEAKPEQQTKMFSAASVRQELSSLNLALHERLSTRERQAIATNDGPSLSKSLGVPSQRVEAVMRTIRAVQEAAQKVQAVGRQPSRGAWITLSQ